MAAERHARGADAEERVRIQGLRHEQHHRPVDRADVSPLLDLARVDPQRVTRDEVVRHEVHRVDGRATIDTHEDVEPQTLRAAELPDARAPAHGLEGDHLDPGHDLLRRSERDGANGSSVGLSHFHHATPRPHRDAREVTSYGDRAD